LGKALEILSTEKDTLAHDFSGLELHGRPGGDRDVDFGLVGVAPDPGAREADVEDAEIPQFHAVPLGEGLGNVIEGALDHLEDIALDESCFIADGYDEIALGEIGHGDVGEGEGLIPEVGGEN
jgi:hypothetical protein